MQLERREATQSKFALTPVRQGRGDTATFKALELGQGRNGFEPRNYSFLGHFSRRHRVFVSPHRPG